MGPRRCGDDVLAQWVRDTFGLTLGYLWGKEDDEATDNRVNADQYSIAAHWRLQKGGLQLAARGSYSFISFDGQRFFVSDAGEEAVERTIEGKWDGSLVSASLSSTRR